MKRLTPGMRWSSWTLGRWLYGILTSLALGSVPVRVAYALGPAAVNSAGKITLQDGRLTARIVGMPLRQVMEEVSRLSGAQVRWLSQDAEEPMSVEFTALPLPEALRRILGEKNFMLFYTSTGEETKLTQIWICSRGEAGGQSVLTPQPVLAVQTTPLSASDPQVEETASEEQDEFDSMPLDTLIPTAMHGQYPSMRLDTATQLGGYAQKGPQVRTILFQVVHTAMNDEDLSSRLRAIEYLGRHAQEDARARAILSHLAHNDNNPQVQEVAARMLQNVE